MFNIPENVLKLAIALNKPIEVLGLSNHAWKSLYRQNIHTVGEVCEVFNNGKIKKMRGIGVKTFYEIEEQINKFLEATT